MFKEKAIKCVLTCLLALGMLTSSGWAIGIEPAESEQAAVMSEERRAEAVEQKAEAEKTSEAAEATKKKETETIESKRTPTTQNAQLLEEYVPEVIIEAEWEKIEENLVPHEWGGSVISCGKEIHGKFRTGTVSFGFWTYNIEPYPPAMPRSITLNQRGNLYILDPVNYRILKFNDDGEYLDTINLERVKPEEGQLGRFEIVEGCDIGFENVYIHVDQDEIWINNFKFSKRGKFIGKSPFLPKSKKHVFIIKTQNLNRAIVQIIDQRAKSKKEIIVNISSELIQRGYILQTVDLLKEDKRGNLYLKVIAEDPKKYDYIEQIYKYDPNGKLVFISKEKKNHDFIYRYQLSQTTAITEDGVIYELRMVGKKEKEKTSHTYKLEPSDKKLMEIEEIDKFFEQMRQHKHKIKEITLFVHDGGYEWYERMKVIRWQKRE